MITLERSRSQSEDWRFDAMLSEPLSARVGSSHRFRFMIAAPASVSDAYHILLQYAFRQKALAEELNGVKKASW